MTKPNTYWWCRPQNSAKVAAKPIQIGESKIPLTTFARNIGVMLDVNVILDIQIKKVCQACLFWLRNIRQIKRCLTVESTQALVQSLVLSRLDCCNSLYHGLPKFQISNFSEFRALLPDSSHAPYIMNILSLFWCSYTGYPFLNVYNSKCSFWLLWLFKVLLHPTCLSNMLGPPLSGDWCNHALQQKLTGIVLFSIIGPRTWNTLPASLRGIIELTSFKKSLMKTILFAEAYSYYRWLCVCLNIVASVTITAP